MTTPADFMAYYRKGRARTERLIPLVPDDAMEWRPADGAFSFGDLLRHLAGLERWMWAENVLGRPSRYQGHAKDLVPGGRQATVDYAAGLRDAAADIFGSLTEHDMGRVVRTPGGAALPVWKWLRAMTEHEAHHRGQFYLMLRLRGIESPPLYGLTSEQVAAGSIPIPEPDPRDA